MRSDESARLQAPWSVRPGWHLLPAGPVLFVGLFIVLLVCAFAPAHRVAAQGGQSSPEAAEQSRLAELDTKLLKAVYNSDSRAFRASMRFFDRSAAPVLAGLPPVVWVLDSSTYRSEPDWRVSARLAGSQLATLGATTLIKRIVGRTRPYSRYSSIESRERGPIDLHDTHGFPSGHAALSFSLATSVALSSERWTVQAPLWIWAAGVSFSRVWLGVHYPLDILGGALVGTSVALLAYLIDSVLRPTEQPGASPPDAAGNGSVQARLSVLVVRAPIGRW